MKANADGAARAAARRPGTRRAAEPRVELADFGVCGGGTLAAEYDAEDDTIRVNVRAVERVRLALGDAEALRFTACAVAHERFHRSHPAASEAAACAHAAAVTGTEPGRYEPIVAGRGESPAAVAQPPPARVLRSPLARAARA